MYAEGFKKGDIFVSSEPYGAKLAEVCEGIFMPYDIERELLPTRATRIREDTIANFADIMPEFQQYLRTTVCLWGAESTGKTTLSKKIARYANGHFLYEYARPYLEAVGPDITIDSMVAIWKGQWAAERHTERWYDKPYLIKDTDLFSTIGYWEQPHWEADLGPVPSMLKANAVMNKADLYLIPASNIPFEADPIRYGGDHRESSDEYWIGKAEEYRLNYVVLDSPTRSGRLIQALDAVTEAGRKKTAPMAFQRSFNSSDRPVRIQDEQASPRRVKV